MWFDHNQVRHGEHPMEDSAIIRGANKAIEKPFNPPNSPNEKVNNVLKWTPPPAGYVKLNCDASFRENGDYCAVGFIARNELGEVLMSGACPVGNCWSVLHAELLAILNGVYFAMESGFHNLLVASDCKQVVHSILIKNDNSYVDVVAQYIRNFKPYFKSLSFVFKGREANCTAHDLANWGITLSSPQILLEDSPAFLSSCIQLDCSF
ncbi:Ribonuclease H-like superfamily protein [Euphorbia peplus]|nr:Ribonuclease H-like superfamily protein [Euphorbia peplus]